MNTGKDIKEIEKKMESKPFPIACPALYAESLQRNYTG